MGSTEDPANANEENGHSRVSDLAKPLNGIQHQNGFLKTKKEIKLIGTC